MVQLVDCLTSLKQQYAVVRTAHEKTHWPETRVVDLESIDAQAFLRAQLPLHRPKARGGSATVLSSRAAPG
jgi:hypothetical protein